MTLKVTGDLTIKGVVPIKTAFTLIFLFFIIAVGAEPNIIKADTQAKRDAENDAKLDNKLKWFGAGCLGGVLPFIVLDAILIADYTDVISHNTFDPYTLDACILSLLGAGAILPTGYVVLHTPILPADRLLGKSPNYVDAYTRYYRKQVKSERILLSASGCLSGMLVGVFTVAALSGHGSRPD